MTITFNLKEPSAKTSAIRIIVTNKWVIRKSIGISVKTSLWSKAKQRPLNQDVDAKLRDMENKLRKVLDDFSTKEFAENAIDLVLKGKTPSKDAKTVPTFWEYMDEYTSRPISSRKQRLNQSRVIERCMGKREDWDGITEGYYLLLTRRMDKEGYGKNYQACVIGLLKAVMNEGYRMRYHTNIDYKFFKKPKAATYATYLTKDEVDMLWNAELKGWREHTRDLFIVGVYTAARYSDYSRLTSDMVLDGQIHFTQNKTKEPVVLPLSPRIKAVLDKYEGRVPSMTQECFNKQLKMLCKELGLDAMVDAGDKYKHKWEMISSHTARRTGASLLYLSGVPIKQCMFITGHRSEATFMQYIRLTKEENARLLADNPFFK